MSDTSSDVTERLKDQMQEANEVWNEALKSGDKEAAAYALGKKYAFITAIEEVNGWASDTGAKQ